MSYFRKGTRVMAGIPYDDKYGQQTAFSPATVLDYDPRMSCYLVKFDHESQPVLASEWEVYDAKDWKPEPEYDPFDEIAPNNCTIQVEPKMKGNWSNPNPEPFLGDPFAEVGL